MVQSVVDTAAHHQAAAVGIDHGVQGRDHRRERPARQGIHLHTSRLTRTHAGLQAFRQTKVDVHRRHVFQIDDVGPFLEVIAHADVAQPGHPVEWRQHTQPLRRRARQIGFGLRHLQRSRTFVHRTLADKALSDQFRIAPMVVLRNRQLGLGLLNLRLLQPVIQLHQGLPLGHLPPIAKKNLGDSPPDLSAHHRALPGTQRAHGIHRLGQLSGTHGSCLHRHLARWCTTDLAPRRRRTGRRSRAGNFGWCGSLNPPCGTYGARQCHGGQNRSGGFHKVNRFTKQPALQSQNVALA